MPEIKTIKDILTPIAIEYGLISIYLFGSYAKGTATEESDIDLMIKGEDIGLLELSNLKQSFAHALKRNVDVVKEEDVSEVFKFLIQDDEVLIYEKS